VTERYVRVERTGRYQVLGDPSRAAEVWFVLHGYGQLAGGFVRGFADLPGVSSGARAVVAPEALSRFYVEDEIGPHGPGSRVGASWMTRSDREHEIRDYVEYLDRVAAAVARGEHRVVVLGFSQGAETASRWAVLGGIRPAELILWGGGRAADLDLEQATRTLGDVRVRLVVGSEDTWARHRVEDSVSRLRAAGLDPERIDYTGGHRLDPVLLSERWPA
jgi:predicted esterase